MSDSLSEELSASLAFHVTVLCLYFWPLRDWGNPAAELGLRGGVEDVEVVAGFLPDVDSIDGDSGALPAAKSGSRCEVWNGRD